MKAKWTTALVFLVTSWAMANVGPVEWAGNMHYYERVDVPVITWTDAKTAAQNRTHLGVAGHLATITSPGEMAFVGQNVLTMDYDYAWLGGYQPPGSQEPDGGWTWITGEPWGYTAWHGVEPSDGYDGEDYLSMASTTTSHALWNDLANSWHAVGGYTVEYPIPEPGTLMLLGLGGLVVLKRRSRPGG